MENINVLINSNWFETILDEVGFFKENNPYPKTQYGLILFLFRNNIEIFTFKNNEGWQYAAKDITEDDMFTQDLNYYCDFDECVNTAIVESICYLSSKLKKI
jgi:hypothetical protein